MQQQISAPAVKLAMWFCLVFTLHALPFLSRSALIGGDEPHYALLTHSIVADGDFQLADDYDAVESGARHAGKKAAGKVLDRHMRDVGGQTVFSHPVGLPLLAAPIVWLNNFRGSNPAPDLPLVLFTLSITFAALIQTWKMVSELVGSTREGALLVTCAYFGSPLWFYSRTFFTEPYTWAFCVFSISSLRSGKFVLGSVWLGLILALKETGAILVAAILASCIWNFGWKTSARLLIGPMLYGLFFVTKNYYTAGTLFSTFQEYQIGDPVGGAIGLVIDPEHGLLWLSPLLCAAFPGWFGQSAISKRFVWPALGAFLAYFAVTAAWIDWRGGSSYGPRLLLPVLPILLLPAVTLFRNRGKFRRLFLPLFVLSFIPNWIAANRPFVAFWGDTPTATLVMENAWLALGGAVVAAIFYHAVSTRFPEFLSGR